MAHEYDTEERDLERAGMMLSRQPTEAGVHWLLALPHGKRVEAWEPGTMGLTPPPEIALLIESVTRGKELVSDPPPRELPSEEYGRFEELTRRLVSPPRAGSGAA